MPLLMSKLYHALLAANVPGEQATAAAEEAAESGHRIGAVERDLAILKWMVGVVITLVVSNLALTFTIVLRLPGAKL